ncbi:hypothetical protein QBC34DRAFT_404170 [Podospora aff. communis PSN243]|uniref:Uncharacterized protein n=1 Tax=Podospora aff. communis PSN243 TaxID=3040156 RepID=A0AAV9GR03_9PEZI|nr:hypothetical protein QBC34DRAFT_404170 [Podospora aff. communis PSN243]
MHRSTPLLLALSALSRLAAAQSSTIVNVIQPLGADDGMYGSVIAVESDLTTVALHCPSTETQTMGDRTYSDPCAELYSATAFIGAKTFSQAQSYSAVEEAGSVTHRVVLGCVIGTKDATCSGTMSQFGVIAMGSTTSTVSTQEVVTTTVEDWSKEASPLTITGGLEKLSAPQATGTGAGAASTSTSKAGAPMVTARAVLAGVAAVVAAL